MDGGTQHLIDEFSSAASSRADAPQLTPPATPPSPANGLGDRRKTQSLSEDAKTAPVNSLGGGGVIVDSPAPRLNSVLTSAKEALRKTSKLQELIEENRIVGGNAGGSSSSDDATEVPSLASSSESSGNVGAAAAGKKRRSSSESARTVSEGEEEIREEIGRDGANDDDDKIPSAISGTSSVNHKSADSSAVDLEDILSDPDFNENFSNF